MEGNKIMKNEKKAFTLAEVLITLGIIGVVAAMTLPTLIQKQKEKQTVVKLKKVYSNLSQAYNQAINEDGPFDNWGIPNDMRDSSAHIMIKDHFKPYLKVLYDCEKMSINLKKTACHSASDNSISTALVLNDGTTVSFSLFGSECAFLYTGKRKTCGAIRVDLNGHKKPNKNGEDIFRFYIDIDAIVPSGNIGAKRSDFAKACNKNIEAPYPADFTGNMYGCTAWVIANENMDYLHCPGELSWEGKHKCKE